MKRRPSLLALSEIYLPIKGGHVVWLHEVCRRIAGTRLLTARQDGLAAREIVDGIEVERIRLGRVPLLRPESLPLYGNLLLAGLARSIGNRPKAILSARILPEGVVGNMLGRILRIPSVVFAHGEEINRLRKGTPLPSRRRMTAMMKRKFLWRAYRRANLVITNSHFTRDLLLEGGVDPGKVAVVHPGTDPERFRPLPKDANLIAKLELADKRVILTVGRLTPRKGQDAVIRALPEVLKRVPNAVYIVGGTGNYASQLRSLAQAMGVDSAVRFLGEVPDDLLPTLYNLTDVFVMANRVTPGSNNVEGFGIVFLEASACEVPVIGGRSGGVPDAIAEGKTGLLVDGDSQSEVMGSIVRVLTDFGLAVKLGKAGRERVCRELTWAHSAERIKSLIDDLVRNSKRGSPGA